MREKGYSFNPDDADGGWKEIVASDKEEIIYIDSFDMAVISFAIEDVCHYFYDEWQNYKYSNENLERYWKIAIGF